MGKKKIRLAEAVECLRECRAVIAELADIAADRASETGDDSHNDPFNEGGSALAVFRRLDELLGK